MFGEYLLVGIKGSSLSRGKEIRIKSASSVCGKSMGGFMAGEDSWDRNAVQFVGGREPSLGPASHT